METYSGAVQGGTEKTEGQRTVMEAGDQGAAEGLENQSDAAGPESNGGVEDLRSKLGVRKTRAELEGRRSPCCCQGDDRQRQRDKDERPW